MARLFVAFLFVLLTSCPIANKATQIKSLADLHAFQSDEYEVDSYIQAAVQLQELGELGAAEQLKRWLQSQESQDILIRWENAEKVMVLCRMLFTAREGAVFRGPRIGMPFYLALTSESDWPLTPIEIVDGVPFKIVKGYQLAGSPESAIAYLEYCQAECNWNTFKYRPATRVAKQKALEKMFSSPKWRGVIPKVALTRQVE